MDQSERTLSYHSLSDVLHLQCGSSAARVSQLRTRSPATTFLPYNSTPSPLHSFTPLRLTPTPHLHALYTCAPLQPYVPPPLKFCSALLSTCLLTYLHTSTLPRFYGSTLLLYNSALLHFYPPLHQQSARPPLSPFAFLACSLLVLVWAQYVPLFTNKHWRKSCFWP